MLLLEIHFILNYSVILIFLKGLHKSFIVHIIGLSNPSNKSNGTMKYFGYSWKLFNKKERESFFPHILDFFEFQTKQEAKEGDHQRGHHQKCFPRPTFVLEYFQYICLNSLNVYLYFEMYLYVPRCDVDWVGQQEVFSTAGLPLCHLRASIFPTFAQEG